MSDINEESSDNSYLNLFTPQDPYTWILWISSFILIILFLIISYFGAREKWYINLPKKNNGNTWLIAGLWVIASLLSYGTFYIIKDYDDKIYGQSRLIAFYLIVSFLNILWAIIFFKYQNFLWTLILLLIVFAVQFYILIFVININFFAGVLILPLQILYGYLFYSFLNLASINNIIL